MDPLTALTAFAPLLVEAGKAFIGKINGPVVKPATIEDALKMREADLKMFEAMQDKGGQGGYAWVDAVVRLQRPLVCIIALWVWAYAHTSGMTDTAAIDNFSAAIGFYLFGDRTLFYLQKK